MRWIVLLAAGVAVVLALEILVAERRRGGRRTTFRQLVGAALTFSILGAAVYAAHWIGLFALPFLALAFVPIGLVARWSILATRGRREAAARASLPPSRSARLASIAAWPVFLTLVALVVAMGLVVATFIGPH